MPEADAIATRLEAAFTMIHRERMDGVPILNPRLTVEVIGMREWNGHWLAVLVTPWFINLMLLPTTEEQRDAWAKLTLGSSVAYRFPAGRFEFLVGEEGELGRFQMCSLFSPVLEFENQEAAQIAARAALEAIFDADIDGSREAEKKEATSGETAPSADVQSAAPQVSQPSRRGLLTGKLSQDRDPA